MTSKPVDLSGQEAITTATEQDSADELSSLYRQVHAKMMDYTPDRLRVVAIASNSDLLNRYGSLVAARAFQRGRKQQQAALDALIHAVRAEQQAALERRFSELISTELDHYAQKIAKGVLRKALAGQEPK